MQERKNAHHFRENTKMHTKNTEIENNGSKGLLLYIKMEREEKHGKN